MPADVFAFGRSNDQRAERRRLTSDPLSAARFIHEFPQSDTEDETMLSSRKRLIHATALAFAALFLAVPMAAGASRRTGRT